MTVGPLAEFFVNGMFLGALYALVAVPMTSTWTTTDVIDVNIGGYVVVAGVVAASIGGGVGVLLGLAAATCMGIVTGVTFLAFHRLRKLSDPIPVVLATFGFLFMTTAAVQLAAGTDHYFLRGAPGTLTVRDVRIPTQGLINLLVAAIFLLILALILRYTMTGLSMRAAALSTESAQLVGIPVRRVQVLTFGAGAAVAGIAGVLAAMTVGVAYSSGAQFTIFAFSAAILFGLQGAVTAFLGGLLLGVAEGLSAGYMPSGWSAIIPPLLIIAVLVFGRFYKFSVREIRA